MSEDLFELHVCQSGRWSCAERFRATEKDEAVAEAQRHFASPDVEAVRVIREVFDDKQQVFKQRTIYRNAKPRGEAVGAKAAATAIAGAKGAPPPRRPAAPVRAMSRADLANAKPESATPARPPERASAPSGPGFPVGRVLGLGVLGI